MKDRPKSVRHCTTCTLRRDLSLHAKRAVLTTHQVFAATDHGSGEHSAHGKSLSYLYQCSRAVCTVKRDERGCLFDFDPDVWRMYAELESLVVQQVTIIRNSSRRLGEGCFRLPVLLECPCACISVDRPTQEHFLLNAGKRCYTRTELAGCCMRDKYMSRLHDHSRMGGLCTHRSARPSSCWATTSTRRKAMLYSDTVSVFVLLRVQREFSTELMNGRRS